MLRERAAGATLRHHIAGAPWPPPFDRTPQRLSNSVVDLINEERVDEADADCETLRVDYPEARDWLMRKAMVCEAREELEQAIDYCQRTLAWMDEHPEGFDAASREPYLDGIERLRRSLNDSA